MLKLLYVFLCYLFIINDFAISIKTQTINVDKGKFMIHMLHSAYLYPHTVDVQWSATTKNKPDLPIWLHLFPSKHKSIAYLIGTPVTPMNHVIIHIIARRTDTFSTAEQYITINLKNDPKYNSSTQQIVEMLITNHDLENLINDRTGKIQRLHNAIRETFRGKYVNPYIYSLEPEISTSIPKLPFYQYYTKQYGTIIKIGTQKKFHSNVQILVNQLQNNFKYCNKSSIISLNRHFIPEFNINRCKFKLYNKTMIKSLLKMDNEYYKQLYSPALKENQEEKKAYKMFIANNTLSVSTYQYSFWESFLIFPLLAVLCILLILLLSYIFFGRREGQHWRDYKTPKEQLQEYLNLRESQKHLRELSLQRQILLMNNDRKTSSPVGIRSFLQLNMEDKADNPKITLHGSSDGISKTIDDTSICNSRASKAKQTVADAVKATGSSLRLYKNPTADSDSDDFEDELVRTKNKQRRDS